MFKLRGRRTSYRLHYSSYFYKLEPFCVLSLLFNYLILHMDTVNTQDQKNKGAFIQLKAYGACDTLTKIKGEPMSCNIRNSLNYWFVESIDGQPTKNDIDTTFLHK